MQGCPNNAVVVGQQSPCHAQGAPNNAVVIGQQSMVLRLKMSSLLRLRWWALVIQSLHSGERKATGVQRGWHSGRHLPGFPPLSTKDNSPTKEQQELKTVEMKHLSPNEYELFNNCNYYYYYCYYLLSLPIILQNRHRTNLRESDAIAKQALWQISPPSSQK